MNGEGTRGDENVFPSSFNWKSGFHSTFYADLAADRELRIGNGTAAELWEFAETVRQEDGQIC